MNSRVCVASLLALCTLVSLVGLSRLRIDDDPETLYRTDSPEYVLFREVSEKFGWEWNTLIAVLRGDEVFTSSTAKTQRTARSDRRHGRSQYTPSPPNARIARVSAITDHAWRRAMASQEGSARTFAKLTALGDHGNAK